MKKNLSCKCFPSCRTQTLQGQIKNHSWFSFCVRVFLVGEEIARPRRSTPTASPLPDAPGFVTAPDVSAGTRQQERFNRESTAFLSDASRNVPSFFGLPSEIRHARYDGPWPWDRTTG